MQAWVKRPECPLASWRGGWEPSAVNYYFGGRERLLSSVYHDAMEWSQTIRSGAISKCVDAAPTWADLPHVFSSVVQARLEEERGLSMLLQELEQEAVTGREPSLRELAAEEVDREWRFWMDLAARFGSSLEEATVWTELALGLTGLLLCEPSPAVRSSWITGLLFGCINVWEDSKLSGLSAVTN